VEEGAKEAEASGASRAQVVVEAAVVESRGAGAWEEVASAVEQAAGWVATAAAREVA
jgi:hypothetical protein